MSASGIGGTSDEGAFWKRCNSCKKPIGWSATYWVCNVSTCNRKRLGLSFCTVSCWDAHLPMMNHREAWAEERTAPVDAADWAKQQERAPRAPREKKEESAPASAPSSSGPKVILRRPARE